MSRSDAWRNGDAGVKRDTRKVKRVEVIVERDVTMKENNPPARRVPSEETLASYQPPPKVLPAPVVAVPDMYDDFLGDVDWDDAFIGLDASEAASPADHVRVMWRSLIFLPSIPPADLPIRCVDPPQ